MSTTLQSIIEEFSDEDQEFIQRKAGVLAEYMIRHRNSPTEFRKAPVKPTVSRRTPEPSLEADGGGSSRRRSR